MSDELTNIAPVANRKPDAIIAGRNAVPAGSLMDRAYAYREKYAPIFGCKLVSLVQGTTPDGGKLLLPHGVVPCVNFPTGHRRHPESRYEWADQPNGDRYGYFVDDEARNAL